MNIQAFLSKKVSQAMIAVGMVEDCDPMVRQSNWIEFGDYQANGIMALAKKIGKQPRQLAERVVQQLKLDGIASEINIAGPGFINIFLASEFLIQEAEAALASPCLNVTPVEAQTIVIDYSSPNVAKEMHIGHVRSTIIGDASARTLEFLGHNVIRANHIGDWGTQFGMLIAYLEKTQCEYYENILLSDLETIYCKAKKAYDEDETFAEHARSYVVKLQARDEHCSSIWKKLVDTTITQNQVIYDRLNVTLTNNDIMGESLYNDMLPEIVSDLKNRGIAVESEGAIVVFLDEFKNKEGEPTGVIIQKKDGGYLYTTTDIACVKYRYEKLHADRILYYIDSRQHQHLMQVWAIVRKAGYLPESVSLEHHMFGMILDKDRHPFKTRSGSTIKLSHLLDEAVERAMTLISKKNPDMSQCELFNLARIIGIGAVKYAELSKNRTTDYIFDWDNMLTFEGNTAPYIQYTYTRILSLFRKAGIDENTVLKGLMQLNDQHEIKLVVRLLQFEETIRLVARDGMPHIMCTYLYDLSGLFSSFYEHCPILSSGEDKIRQSRLKIVLLTARTLKCGLNTLGIETAEHM